MIFSSQPSVLYLPSAWEMSRVSPATLANHPGRTVGIRRSTISLVLTERLGNASGFPNHTSQPSGLHNHVAIPPKLTSPPFFLFPVSCCLFPLSSFGKACQSTIPPHAKKKSEFSCSALFLVLSKATTHEKCRYLVF